MKLLQNPPLFDSKKASLLAVGMALIAFVMTGLPLLFPHVPEEVWTRLAELLQQALIAYLVSQGAVDVVEALRAPAEAIDQEPAEGDEVA